MTGKVRGFCYRRPVGTLDIKNILYMYYGGNVAI